eukprot:TRINITY_DN21167_c0_g1_i2.p1 TRINITY_DN21167_c0_g1~~TRINITY_DN21167_c0_g1_i2.p1  ORF type:complete len:530 (+),score=79.71 TRINITY_DN21167_c0_g1_i2:23-1591(+)
MAARRGILDQKYIFEYDIGCWTFGTIQVLRDRETSQLRTCKTVPKATLQHTSGVLARLRALQELQHPHIANILDIIEDQSSFYIISEALPGGGVDEWLQRLDESNWVEEQTCAAYTRQIVLALTHSHAAQVHHRDLRPSSLQLTSKLPDATVKVSDFGLAAILDSDNAIVQKYPNAYIAPEVLFGGDTVRPSTADMWSVGAIAHALLVGHAPTENSGGRHSGWKLAARVRGGDDDHWADRSALSRDFVVRLLRPVGERPTAAKALQHPWLKGTMPIGGVHLRAQNDVAREARHKTLCYTLAVLLVPVMLPYRDFEQLKIAFQQSDSDHDGLITRSAAQRLLLQRCPFQEAVTAAISIADVGKEDVADLCAATIADLIARDFFASGSTGAPLVGPLRATDLAPRLLKKFFEVFGDKRQPVVSAHTVRSKLRTATARDFATLAGVHYDEILACLPEDQVVDTQVLASQLSVNAGRGTPLAGSDLAPLKEENTWSAPWSLDVGGFFSTCSMGGKREESPHSMRLF